MAGLKKVQKNQTVQIGGLMAVFHLIKQMFDYAAAPALLSSGKGMFDRFGHHEMVRLHCSRHHGELSKLFLGFLQTDKRLFAEVDQPRPKAKATWLHTAVL